MTSPFDLATLQSFLEFVPETRFLTLRFLTTQNRDSEHGSYVNHLLMLYLLTIDSDAALVSSTFEITHSSNFESRWLLPSGHLENSDFSAAARIDPFSEERGENVQGLVHLMISQ